MNKYAWVAMTYARRRRFWILAACYLLMVYWWVAGVTPPFQVVASANLGVIVTSLIALQLRRQFGTPSAHLVPGFAGPHLAVGAAIGGCVWLLLPSVQALLGNWPWGGLAFHAVAGLIGAAVACWPKSIALLAALPVACAWSFGTIGTNNTLAHRLIEGQVPELAFGLVLASVVAQAIAAWVLLRQSDRSVSHGDDLVLEPSIANQTGNPFSRAILASRDAVAERFLTMRPRPLWAILRWRVPVAVSWVQLALPVAFVLAMVAVTILTREAGWTLFGMVATTCVLFVAPFSSWHPRRRSMPTEFMWPVARGQFLRQQGLALALDLAMWVALATVIDLAVVLFINYWERSSSVDLLILRIEVILLWSMAVFIYGVAAATIRFQYWVLLITALGSGWLFGYWFALALYYSRNRMDGHPNMSHFYVFVAITVALGALMTWFSYRRLLVSDVS